MIQYEDISPDDMARYWGEGCVFMQHDGFWNAYKLEHAGEDTVRLVRNTRLGTFGAPPDNEQLTYYQFYQRALLHRPPLGVLVRKSKEVYVLGWQHANGQDLVKAIRDGDVYADAIIEKPAPRAAQRDAHSWPEMWANEVTIRKDLLRRIPFDNVDGANDELAVASMRAIEYTQHPANAIRPRAAVENIHGIRKGALKLVLEFLNQERSTIRAAMSGPINKNTYLAGTSWLQHKEGRTLLMSGKHTVGAVSVPHGAPLFHPLGVDLMDQIGQRMFADLY